MEGERDAADVTVGVMGTGEMGSAAAALLRASGFRVRQWSRSGRRSVEGCESFAGPAGLPAFLQRSEILVNLLPLTRDTEDIVSWELLSQLPRGACFVNGARGGHVVEADLLRALDCGQLAQAVLDVYREEPLPASSRLWKHPGVRLTPHTAAVTNIETSMEQIVENWRRNIAGEPLLNVVDASAGY